MDTLIFFASQEEAHEWFEKNHENANELWFGFYKVKSMKTGITYKQALDEALCFGWIDGLRKSIDEERWMIRFTPRKSNSIWSNVNIKRMEELLKMDLVKSMGIKAFEARTENRSGVYSFENRPKALPDEYEQIFVANPKAWEYFMSKPPSYRTPAIWWVISAKTEATRLKRLNILIEDSENNRTIALLTRKKK